MIGNMFEDVQEIAKLKIFLGGYDNDGYPYPFPLLFYLNNVDGDIEKYIYEKKYQNSEKNAYTI